MSVLPIFKAKNSEVRDAAPDQLVAVLLDLTKYGRPHVGMYSSGWHSHIDVNISPTGAKFEVRSDFGMSGPLEAVLQCRDRLMSAVKQIGGAK